MESLRAEGDRKAIRAAMLAQKAIGLGGNTAWGAHKHWDNRATARACLRRRVRAPAAMEITVEA